MLLGGQPPNEGDVMVMPDLATTFEALAREGHAGFYQGRVAEAIVACVQSHGGKLTLEDLAAHRSTVEEPIGVDYEGVRLHEIPPNGQGLAALLAVNLLKQLPELKGLSHNSADYLHLVIEAMRLAFADTAWYVADPAFNPAPLPELLSEEYAAERAALICMDSALLEAQRGSPVASCDTVQFAVCCPLQLLTRGR